MVQTVVKYADGGKVIMPKPAPVPKTQLPEPKRGPKPKRVGKRYADGGKVERKPAPPPPKKPAPASTRDTIASPKPESAADALRNQRKRQEQLLGLKDGGKVRRRR